MPGEDFNPSPNVGAVDCLDQHCAMYSPGASRDLRLLQRCTTAHLPTADPPGNGNVMHRDSVRPVSRQPATTG